MPAEKISIAIIGAGPAGLAAGAQAARAGVSHVVLERSALAHTIVKYQKGKHVMDEPPSLPLRAEMPLEFKAGTREQVLAAWARDTESAQTNLKVGPEYEVVQVSGAKGAFELTLKGGAKVAAENIVVAIGLQGNLRRFGVPGDDLPHVSYQLDDPDDYIDRDIVVVGVGDAGIENALALCEKNEVALINRGAEFDRAKPMNRQLIEAAIGAGKIAHHTNSKVKSIEPGAVVLETEGSEERLPCNLLIGRLGAIPPRKFLESFGVEFPSDDRGAVPQVSATYESNVPGVYLVGALVGYPLIKNCMNQGYEVVEHIRGVSVEPADEPILREKFAGLPGSVGEVLARIQETLPLFRSLTTIQLREFLYDAVVHRPRSGDLIFNSEDFAESVYFTLQGTVDVVVPESDADADRDAQEKHHRTFTLSQGEFFGEMALLSGRRRGARVVAGPDCILIEVPRLPMNKLVKSVPDVKRRLDEAFISRKLQLLFPGGVAKEALDALASTAVIETFKAGDALFRQGEESNGVSLIRRGSVTVTRSAHGRESVLAYIPAGNIVGEGALFDPQARRGATVTATVETEAVRLPSAAVIPFLRQFSFVREALGEIHQKRLVENVTRSGDTRTGQLVDFLVSVGAGEATDMLLIDESLCVRCDNCEKACAQTHGGISRLDREAGPMFAMVRVPTSCRHCENPKCMTDCPPDALRRHPDGEVFIMDSCIGCGNCVQNCPYSVIQLAYVEPPKRRNLLFELLFGWGEGGGREHSATAEKKACKCDLCGSVPGMLRGGRDGARTSACVASCPTGAILRVNPSEYVKSLWGKSAE